MAGFASSLAVALAATFAVAAILKLGDVPGTAADFASLGLPQSGLLAWAVPGIEVGVAVGLLVRPGWAATLAFAMLAAFTTLLAGVVRSGRIVSCACFGGSSSDPIGRRHLLRNALLMLWTLPVLTIDRLTMPSAGEFGLAMIVLLLTVLTIRGQTPSQELGV